MMKRIKKVKTPKRIKPEVKLIGEDGNIFFMLGACAKALRRSGQSELCEELSQKVMSASDYDDALSIMMDYCNII